MKFGATAPMNVRRLDESIALHRQVAAQDPLRVTGYHNLGLALNASDRLVGAEAAYRKALELAPGQGNLRAKLALNLLAQGRGDEARNWRSARLPSFRVSIPRQSRGL